jgi:hypothetical protein
MKELHNDIFSTTECIPKELLEKYASKNLEKKELHQIQKHLLECEMCSEALDGLDLIKVAPAFFAKLDKEIDLLATKKAGKNTRNFNTYLIAASITLLCTVGYFSYQFIHTTLSKNSNLAVAPQITEKELPLSEQTTALEESEKVIPEIAIENKESQTPENNITNKPSTLRINETKEDKGTPSVSARDEVAQESAFLKDADDIVNAEEAEELNAPKGISPTEDQKEVIQKAEGVSERKKNNNTSQKTRSAAPSQVSETASGMAYQKNEPAYKISSIGNYKVVDYSYEYSLQEEQEFDKKQKVLENTPPQYPNKQAKAESEKDSEKEIIEITYRQTLENAIQLYDKQKFSDALLQFKLILSKHPSDVNAIFYGALCHYHLKKYTDAHSALDKTIAHPFDFFYQEAKWYKAQVYVQQNETKKAKTLLKEIIDANGFYKNQATELLKEIN